MILCPAAEVHFGLPVIVRLSATNSVIVLRADSGLVAYKNQCPHMGIELDWAAERLLSRSGRYLVCTGHGALFEPDSGLCVKGPCVGETLAAVAVRVQDQMVVLDD